MKNYQRYFDENKVELEELDDNQTYKEQDDNIVYFSDYFK